MKEDKAGLKNIKGDNSQENFFWRGTVPIFCDLTHISSLIAVLY